ncbi:MAG: choice-of-anchor J domain-containing protein [bacterium]|nr:choice-of-anchor J domain-containing protein [bacterium]
MKIFFIFIFLLPALLSDATAQVKLLEGFEGTAFPPTGWSVANIIEGNGEWVQSSRTSRSGNKCAVSNYTPTGSSNFLITKRFVPTTDDSLIFYFRQTFWNVYKDTFSVYVSTTDSLASGMTNLLYKFKDSITYPSPNKYGRYAFSLNAYAGDTVWIGFFHKNLDGENLRLDDVSVGTPYINEVGIVNNLFPYGEIASCSQDYFVPQIEIKNYGTNNQSTPFNVVYSITGPVDYQNTKSLTLNSNQSAYVSFDSLITTNEGTYNVKIYSSLASDQNRSNDTLRTTFTIVNSNFGGGLSGNGGYFFSNSTTCAFTAPSHPQFNWKDTIGSKSLIINRANVSGGSITGTLDNGFFSLGNIIHPGSKIKFFSSVYDSVFISTNGLISFSKNNFLQSSDPNQLSLLMLQPVSILSPLWMDLDFNNANVSGSRLSYKIAGNQILITFDRAPLKNGGASDYVSFQVCIETENSATQNSGITVHYSNEKSGGDFISNFNSNQISSYFVGIKNTAGDNSLVYRYKDTNGVTESRPLFNSSIVVEFGPDQTKLNSRSSLISLKVLLEAISPLRDTVTVNVRDTRSPFKLLESKKVYLDLLGNVNFSMSIPSDDYKFYLSVKHRNSIETWSRDSGVVFNSFSLNYDFSTDSSKAYGNNMKMKLGNAYIYTGDADQNGIADVSDMILIRNDLLTFATGYLKSDLNGDGFADAADILFCHNNSIRFVSAISPLNPLGTLEEESNEEVKVVSGNVE